jgi:hypothetical protein
VRSRQLLPASCLLPFVLAFGPGCSGSEPGNTRGDALDGTIDAPNLAEAAPAAATKGSSVICGTNESETLALVSPNVNTTPPFGRPNWGPHSPMSKKRITWTIQKNYTASGVWADRVGTNYSKRGSNAFIFNEIRKAFASWASTADVEFQFVASGTTDWQVRFLYQPPPAKWFDGLWDGSTISINEDASDFGSFGYEAQAADDPSALVSPYRTAVHPGEGWLFEVAAHEIGHGLGFAHAWSDNWDYHYAAIVDNVFPQPQKVCTDPGARCLFPVEKNAPDFSVMDYRNGNYDGRHPRHRVLTSYDIAYSQAMYGQAGFVPLIEMSLPDAQDTVFALDWDTASTYIDSYSYENIGSGRFTTSYVNNFFGAIRPFGTVSGTWINLMEHFNPNNGRRALGTANNIPSGYQLGGTMGRIRTSSGEGFTTPLYRHYSSSADNFRYTTSSTSPSGYVNQGLLGYITYSPGTAVDNTVRPWDDGASYQLTSVLTNKAVGTNAVGSNGTAVVNDATVRSAGPQWRFNNSGDGYYRVRDAESWLLLDVENSSASDGAKTRVWTDRGIPSQEWKIEASGSGYRFVARHSNKCLQVPSSASKVQLTQQACNGSTNQQFKFLKKQQSFDSAGVYKIVARHSNKPLDVSGNAATDGLGVEQWSSTNGDDQRWRIAPAGTGWTLTAKHSGKLMEIPNGNTANGTQARQWGTTTQTNREWRLNLNGEGYFQLVNNMSNKCLDIQSASQSDGAKAVQYTCSTGQNQQFNIVRVE